jgi:hypothetical protein
LGREETNGVNTPYASKDRSRIVLEAGPEKSNYENEDDDEDEIGWNISHRKDRQARGYRAQSWHGD